MGLPWYVAATVISIAHIDSLKMETQCSAPGEQPKFLGVRWVSREGREGGEKGGMEKESVKRRELSEQKDSWLLYM